MLLRLRNLFRSNKLDADIREELEFHRSQSHGSFGNVTRIQEQAHDASTLVWVETLWQDVRYGLRQLRKAPILVTTAVLSLALGIGANTAIFTLIDAVILKSLPVRDPSKLALFYTGADTGTVTESKQFPSWIFSYPSWQYLHAHNDAFEDLCAFRQGGDRIAVHLQGTDQNGPGELAEGHLVSGNYFQVLGVPAAAGRLFELTDDSLTAPPTAVLSYRYWQKRFQQDTSLIGKTVVLNNTSFTITGVAAREFFGERVQDEPDYWVPLSFQPQILRTNSWLSQRNTYWLNLMGRLKPGMTIRTAAASVDGHLRQFYAEQAGTNPSKETRQALKNVHVELKPGGAGISGVRHRYSEPLQLLMAVVAVVLLIACANIATLLLARASARHPEFLARLALGASPFRLMRQVLTESLLLSAFGGIAGVAVAWWSVKGMILLMGIDSVVKMQPNFLVLGFSLGISFLTGLLFGIVPSFKFSKVELRQSQHGGSRFGGAQTLIVLQIALSFVLLIGGGLLARSFMALEFQNMGFQRDHVLLVHIDPHTAGYKENELYPLYRELDDRLNRIPGVITASIARYTPISGSYSSGSFAIENYSAPAGKNMSLARVEVGPRFFETLRIPVQFGRAIGPRDTPAAPAVTVVNETFIATYFPNQNPIGRHISLGTPFAPPGAEIIGVVPDSKYYDLHDKVPPMAYFAAWQLKGDSPYMNELVIRTAGPPLAIAAEVRKVLKSISTKLPALDIGTLERQVDDSLYEHKLLASLCGGFGVTALLLATIGIYGTVAYAVQRRTTEIGIRMAIGARKPNVLWMVLRESVFLTGVGLVIGLPVALASTRWIKSFLFGIPAGDPVSIFAAVSLIALAALLSGLLPASRAAKVDPMFALRHE